MGVLPNMPHHEHRIKKVDKKSAERQKNKNARLPFGCPFYFHNKEEHQLCLNYELKRISDVRQHIYRYHVQPSNCPRCGIVFQNDITCAQRDIHEHQQICEAASDVCRYSGATSDQLASISNAATHRCSSTDEERWYGIWDIMFPSVARPRSPYIDIPAKNRRSPRRTRNECVSEAKRDQIPAPLAKKKNEETVERDIAIRSKANVDSEPDTLHQGANQSYQSNISKKKTGRAKTTKGVDRCRDANRNWEKRSTSAKRGLLEDEIPMIIQCWQ